MTDTLDSLRLRRKRVYRRCVQCGKRFREPKYLQEFGAQFCSGDCRQDYEDEKDDEQ